MTCRIYAHVWDAHIPRLRELRENWRHDKYVRFDKFMGAEPPRHPVQRCECGAPDRWKCWNHYKMDVVMGTRGGEVPPAAQDPRVRLTAGKVCEEQKAIEHVDDVEAHLVSYLLENPPDRLRVPLLELEARRFLLQSTSLYTLSRAALEGAP